MSIVLGLGLMGVLIMAVNWMRRIRRRNAATVAATAESEGILPTFSIVALGTRGAGKTLLLASMFHELMVPAGRSYFLTAPHEQVISLGDWYAQAADTGADWPAGTMTGESRSFLFTVCTRLPSGEIRAVMRLEYLEYAGGLLTDAQALGSTSQPELLRRIDAAHALVGILDGFRIRQWLDGMEAGRRAVQQSVDTLVSLMFQQTCPVTFVVTKWDLLAHLDPDEDARLVLVRDRLMRLPGFRDLVEQHSRNRVLRLVPVSALGSDFAELDGAGAVAKLPGASIHPRHVDVPLSAVVPDLFEQVERDVDGERLRMEFARLHRENRLSPGVAAAELGRFLVRISGSALTGLGPVTGFFGDAALELLGAHQDGARQSWQEGVDERMDAAERAMAEFRCARRTVLRDLRRRVDVLEGRLPASRLGTQILGRG